MYRSTVRQIVLYFLVHLFTFYTTPSANALILGTQTIEFTIAEKNRPITAEIYYPTLDGTEAKDIDSGIWKRKSFIKNASLSPQQKVYPLVIFSHGWQGDRLGQSWIAEELVAEGYIVAMIDHTHNTSYEHSDEFIYTSMWQRPLDLSALLDYLFQHPHWSQVIDKSKIAAGGFSLGGLTALWIAGIEGDAIAFKEAMESYARWNEWPESVKKRAFDVDWANASKSYYDARVKAVFSISPDLGKSFKPEGLKKAKIPVLLIVGDRDIITPSSSNAGYYSVHISNAELLTIKNAAHYTFLNTCSSFGQKIVPHLCKDVSPMTRSETHKEAATKIKTFLKEKLSIN